MFRRLLAGLFRPVARHGSRLRLRVKQPLVVETLEDRTVPSANYVPDEILIQFAPGAGEGLKAAVRSRVQGTLAERIETAAMRASGAGSLELIKLPTGHGVPNALQRLRGLPGVRFAEPNAIVTLQATSNDPYYTNGSLWGMYGDGTTPANPFGSQAAEAWAAGRTGSSTVAVGILDEGIDYRHPDLYENIFINPGEIPELVKQYFEGKLTRPITFTDLNAHRSGLGNLVKDGNGNGYIDAQDILNPKNKGGWADGLDGDKNGFTDDICGWDFLNNDRFVYDGPSDDHGTHVAGTIGAKGGNGVGVAGVNWAVTLIPAKFVGSNGTIANAIKAIDYVTGLKVQGANVVATNNSWGVSSGSQALLDAIVRSARQDILFIAAAMNGGGDQVGDNNDVVPVYPANYDTTAGVGYDSVIAVAALDKNGSRASFSNYGANTVDLAAPGVAVYSTLPAGKYGSYNGTSMATPHVTGAAALYAAHYAAQHGARPSPLQIRTALLEAAKATPTPAVASITVTGGRLNVSGALAGLDEVGPRVTHTSARGLVGRSADGKVRVTVTFDEPILPETVNPEDVTVIRDGESVSLTVDAVTILSDRVIEVSFTPLAAAFADGGTYTLAIGPAITDLGGRGMDQDKDRTGGELNEDRFRTTFKVGAVGEYPSNDGGAIVDWAQSGSMLVIPAGVSIRDLKVRLNLTHPNVGDLVVTLVSPSGAQVTLINRRGGTGDNFTDTVLTDGASLPISSVTASQAPFTAWYVPEQSLAAAFPDGTSAEGIWWLYVSDSVLNGQQGAVNYWSLAITPPEEASTVGVAPFEGGSSGSGGQATDEPAPMLSAAFWGVAVPDVPPPARAEEVRVGDSGKGSGAGRAVPVRPFADPFADEEL